jgi:Protein of unknown function (DUF2505)
VDFTIEQQLHGSPTAVLDELLSAEFLAARAELPKLSGSEVLELTRDDSTAHVRVRMRFTARLAPAVTAVVDPDKLTWVDDATYTLADRSAHHEIQPDHYADRLSCTYEEVVREARSGALRTLSGSLKVRALLVGGRVEGAIVSGLREYSAAEADLLNGRLGASGA